MRTQNHSLSQVASSSETRAPRKEQTVQLGTQLYQVLFPQTSEYFGMLYICIMCTRHFITTEY